jgi:hypothetical protein
MTPLAWTLIGILAAATVAALVVAQLARRSALRWERQALAIKDRLVEVNCLVIDLRKEVSDLDAEACEEREAHAATRRRLAAAKGRITKLTTASSG